jgi:hypothetical protein
MSNVELFNYAFLRGDRVHTTAVLGEQNEDFINHLVEVTDTDSAVLCPSDKVLGIDYDTGSLYLNGEFTPPPPFPSWTWDGDHWVAPIPQPNLHHVWKEITGEWVPFDSPFPSWTWDGDHWIAPVQKPRDENGSIIPARWDEDAQTWDQSYTAPFPSWIWNEEVDDWYPPIPLSQSLITEIAGPGGSVRWDEDTVSWVAV